MYTPLKQRDTTADFSGSMLLPKLVQSHLPAAGEGKTLQAATRLPGAGCRETALHKLRQ